MNNGKTNDYSVYLYTLFRTNHEHVNFVEILQDPEADLSEINPLPSTHAFIDFLRRRALDDSVYVRKNALQVSQISQIDTTTILQFDCSFLPVILI